MKNFENSTNRTAFKVWSLLAALFLIRTLLISNLGVKIEEAYYWNYAQHPDWSYFDHPPMVAWLIGSSTWFGGDSSFWVHLPALLILAALTLLVYQLGNSLFEPRVGLLAALLINVLPIFAVLSLVTLPDLPLLLFWTCGMTVGWEMISRRDPRLWLLVGALTGLGCDSKYPAILIPFGIFLYLILTQQWNLILNRWTALGALTALLCFLPVIIWNSQHHWVSILFQGTGRFHESVSIRERLGSWLMQLGALSPFGFVALALSLRQALQERHRPPVRYLLCWTLPFLGLMILVSLRRGIHLNWPLPGYIGGILLMSSAGVNLLRVAPKKAYIWTGLVLGGSFLLWSPLWIGSVCPVPVLNRGDDYHGWRELASKLAVLKTQMPRPKQTFIVGHGYQAASMIAFYDHSPHLTLSNNTLGEEALGYDYFEDPRDFLGWDAILVVYQTPGSDGAFRSRVMLDENKLRNVFGRIEGPDKLDVERGGSPLRRYLIYRCFGYRGSSTHNYPVPEKSLTLVSSKTKLPDIQLLQARKE